MSKKRTHLNPVAFLMLILIGMSVLVYQTGQTYVQTATVAQATDNSDAENPATHHVFSASQDVILSVSNIHLDQEFHQIKEIIFGDEKDVYKTPVVAKRISSFFKTLFQQVISPNAP